MEEGVCSDRAQGCLPHERRTHKVQLLWNEPAQRMTVKAIDGDRDGLPDLSGISSGLSKSSNPRLDRKSGMVSYDGASHRELMVRLSLLILPTLCVFSNCLRGCEDNDVHSREQWGWC